ncbi:DUF4321 domain-containing protein [Thermobrachium celere]|uniref:DUF4321 domain-containing protein n=1 Tax=Thermobrachium celere DSM 8682 TaxID=941824 RepID=R7RQ07_9CLOT|nr:DUF4321 domain-containing protein [Thermobrachium celere]GFR34894.1 hypothetical protein TCEA9_07060 [Thermobrachium celere]CDF58129.1 hypothetical protein TCEL_00175 [Thermobrachium celere DSM 8682]
MGKVNYKLQNTIIIVICLLASEALNNALKNFKSLKFITTELIIGTPKPINVDLKMFNLVFGLTLNLSFISFLGLLIGIILIKKYR